MKHRTPIVCPPPATKGAASAVAAPAAPELGVCTRHMNRHHRSRSFSNDRSSCLIRHSLAAIATAITNAAQASTGTAISFEKTSCIAVPPEDLTQYAFLVISSSAAVLLLAQVLWFGVIAPWIALRVNASIMRSDKALDAVVDARLRRREAARAGQAERRTSRAAINLGGCVAPQTASVPDGNHGDNFPGDAA